jgi:molecular chaperone GrpE (heat shock protein)
LFYAQVPPRPQLSEIGARHAPEIPREEQMSAQLSFKTAVCTEYEHLLIACQKALETWREQREEIAKLGSKKKEATDELLRLQADYAKAYSRLKKHQDDCALCRFVSKIGSRSFASMSMLQ